MTISIVSGDCRVVLPTLEAGSFDSCVTDPPYGLSFMGKAWDHGVPGESFWREVLRVLKPGAHLLAFGGTRTFHRLTCAIEDAGFEIRDCIMWIYGSGFPKSLNLDGERQGWGTALKPAWEPIIVARKPLAGTVADNVQRFGTGALNIDGCRVETADGYADNAVTQGINTARTSYAPAGARRTFAPSQAGRWPANLIHDGSEEVIALFPQSDGQASAVSGGEPSTKTRNVLGLYNERAAAVPRGDTGSAARFFYCAKADRADREEGCERLPMRSAGEATGGRKEGSAGLNSPRAGASRGNGARNHHPTVKPTDLMRYLCRLVTPPGGHVLDPFCGSGSTLKAARLEGFRATGIELSPEYAAIAEARATAGTMGLAL